jgi:glucose-1-phosphate cytidylyltransferase
MLTYGDGVANVNIERLVAFHRERGRLGTVTAVRPSSRFGELSIDQGLVKLFHEKPQVNQGWINGGFFVFDRAVLNMLVGDQDTLEDDLLTKLSTQGQLAVHQHDDFWQCMDTYREMELLNDLWRSDKAPWAIWKAPVANSR